MIYSKYVCLVEFCPASCFSGVNRDRLPRKNRYVTRCMLSMKSYFTWKANNNDEFLFLLDVLIIHKKIIAKSHVRIKV